MLGAGCVDGVAVQRESILSGGAQERQESLGQALLARALAMWGEHGPGLFVRGSVTATTGSSTRPSHPTMRSRPCRPKSRENAAAGSLASGTTSPRGCKSVMLGLLPDPGSYRNTTPPSPAAPRGRRIRSAACRCAETRSFPRSRSGGFPQARCAARREDCSTRQGALVR